MGKPNNFTAISGGLSGDIEIYTQEGDNPRKFTVDQVKDYVENNISLLGGTETDYSLNETKTDRKWVNDKPVYEIVLDYKRKSDVHGNLNHKLNIDTYLSLRITSNTPSRPEYKNVIGTDNTYITKINKNTISIEKAIKREFDFIILEYTKL